MPFIRIYGKILYTTLSDEIWVVRIVRSMWEPICVRTRSNENDRSRLIVNGHHTLSSTRTCSRFMSWESQVSYFYCMLYDSGLSPFDRVVSLIPRKVTGVRPWYSVAAIGSLCSLCIAALMFLALEVLFGFFSLLFCKPMLRDLARVGQQKPLPWYRLASPTHRTKHYSQLFLWGTFKRWASVSGRPNTSV